MSKLYDIKGYFDSSFSYQFNDNDMWEGKFLLEDDGWFEGVVKDVGNSYTEDRFIFGVYHPGKVIELFKWTPTSYSSPFVFHGKKSDEGYQGEFEVIGLLDTVPYGVSRITTEEKVLGSDDEKMEVDDVKRRIERYKVFFMDDVGREFYDNSIAMRSSMCEIILRGYEGREFTPEESDSIMSECGPVNDRVIEATCDVVKQYMKKPGEVKIFDNLDEDDDLPF